MVHRIEPAAAVHEHEHEYPEVVLRVVLQSLQRAWFKSG
jgi:hypothetical protein